MGRKLGKMAKMVNMKVEGNGGLEKMEARAKGWRLTGETRKGRRLKEPNLEKAEIERV